MNCRTCEQMIFLNDTDDIQSVHSHLESCPSCAEKFSEWRVTSELIAQVAIEEIAPLDQDRLTEKIMNKVFEPAPIKAVQSSQMPWWRLGYCLFSVALIALFSYQSLKVPAQNDTRTYPSEVTLTSPELEKMRPLAEPEGFSLYAMINKKSPEIK